MNVSGSSQKGHDSLFLGIKLSVHVITMIP